MPKELIIYLLFSYQYNVQNWIRKPCRLQNLSLTQDTSYFLPLQKIFLEPGLNSIKNWCKIFCLHHLIKTCHITILLKIINSIKNIEGKSTCLQFTPTNQMMQKKKKKRKKTSPNKNKTRELRPPQDLQNQETAPANQNLDFVS